MTKNLAFLLSKSDWVLPVFAVLPFLQIYSGQFGYSIRTISNRVAFSLKRAGILARW